jgi:hypothetical protein
MERNKKNVTPRMLEFNSLLQETHFILRCNLDQWTSSRGPQAPCLKCGLRVCVLVLVFPSPPPKITSTWQYIFFFGKAEFKSCNIHGAYSTA